VGSAAVEPAEKIFGSNLCQQAKIVIGAGKMGEACVRRLAGLWLVSSLPQNFI
jgi:glutamyl-tRNA reductase